MLLIQNTRVNWETPPDPHPWRDRHGERESANPVHTEQHGATNVEVENRFGFWFSAERRARVAYQVCFEALRSGLKTDSALMIGGQKWLKPRVGSSPQR